MFTAERVEPALDPLSPTLQAGRWISSLPVMGAALTIKMLPYYVDWLNADHRDLEIQDTISPAFLDGDWQAAIAPVRRMFGDFQGRIGIHGPYKGLSLLAEDPLVADVVVARLRKALVIGAELGASQMVIHSPFTTFGSPFVTHKSSTHRERELDAVRALIERVLPFAEEANCRLVIENIYDTNPIVLVDLVRSIGSEYVGLSIDIGHAYLTSRIGGPPPDQWLRETAPWLDHVHLHDTDGCADRHWRMGKGSINWTAVFEALQEVEAHPRLILETAQPTDLRASVQWLSRHCLAR